MNLRSKAFISFVVLAVVYASINLLAAPTRVALERYGISSTALRFINATVIFPVIATWFLGLYGYQRLKAYTAHIKNETEGHSVTQLTQGVWLIVLSMPITSTLSSVMNAFSSHHPALHAITTIVINYASVAFAVLAAWFISLGGRGLSEQVKYRPNQFGVHVIAFLLIVISVTYGYLVAAARHDIYSIYHLPVPLVLLTVVIPYVFSWYLGLLAANNIYTYTKKLDGAIYRQGWSALAFGIIWVVVFSVVLQYVTAVSAKLATLSLVWILVLLYGVIVLRALGFVYVAVGSKRLIKIEEA